MRYLIPSAIALALCACGGASSPPGAPPALPSPSLNAQACPPPAGNVWLACQLSPPDPASEAHTLAQGRAYFHPADSIVYCPTGAHTTLLAVQYPYDGTAQLASGQWVQLADIVMDDPTYACGGQIRPDGGWSYDGYSAALPDLTGELPNDIPVPTWPSVTWSGS